MFLVPICVRRSLQRAELAAISSIVGKLPSVDVYMSYMDDINTMADDIYRYLNFHEIESFQKAAAAVTIPIVNKVTVEV